MEYNKNYPFKRRQKLTSKEETIYSNLAATTVNYMGIQANTRRRTIYGMRIYTLRHTYTHTHKHTTQNSNFERHWLEEKEENFLTKKKTKKIHKIKISKRKEMK